MDDDPNFKEFLESLNTHSVRYLLVGAFAMALHDMPRFTGDLDVWIETSAENAERMLAALRTFGFGSLTVTAADFAAPGNTIQIGYPPRRIDILTSISGVTFEEAWPRHLKGTYGNVPVYFIGLKDLERNKAASDRPKDRKDLRRISRKRKKS